MFFTDFIQNKMDFADFVHNKNEVYGLFPQGFRFLWTVSTYLRLYGILHVTHQHLVLGMSSPKQYFFNYSIIP